MDGRRWTVDLAHPTFDPYPAKGSSKWNTARVAQAASATSVANNNSANDQPAERCTHDGRASTFTSILLSPPELFTIKRPVFTFSAGTNRRTCCAQSHIKPS